MAIYHLSAKLISRSNGRSATGAAAYRAGVEIVDQRTGLVHDYTRKSGVDFVAILTPDNAPDWMQGRSQLWNAVERVEVRRDAQLAREVEVALPVELTPTQMQSLVMDFTRTQFVAQGMVADVALHHIHSENPHAHILLTTRTLTPDGFGLKCRDWNRTEQLQQWRQAWESHANQALVDAAHEARIDHRTLAAQGIDRIPQIHLGPQVITLEMRGIETERGQRALAIEEHNAQLRELQQHVEALDHEYHREIEASPARPGFSARDRTVSASSGELGRRDPAELAGGSAGIPADQLAELRGPGPGYTPDPADAGRDRASGEAAGEPLSRGPKPELEHYLAGRLDSGADGYPVSGSYDRIMALAPTVERRSAGESADRGEHPVQVPTGPAGVRHDLAGDGLGAVDPSGQAHGYAHTASDRTYQAVRRQLQALRCECYEVGIRRPTGQMLIRSWSPDETLNAVGWLKRENAKGADIYLRPVSSGNRRGTVAAMHLGSIGMANLREVQSPRGIGSEKPGEAGNKPPQAVQNPGLVLLDDLTQAQVADLKRDGLAPAAVIETSPYNFQAWIRLSEQPLSPAVATQAAKNLAQTYGSDPNSADWRHFGRLAGFTNRKPEHTTENGLNPYVLAREGYGQQAARGPQIVTEAREQLRRDHLEADRGMRLDAILRPQTATKWHDPVAEYQNRFKSLLGRYGSNLDHSRADWAVCRAMAMDGYSAQDLTQALNQASPELPTRKLGHEQDYVERTVTKVMALPEVKQAQADIQARQAEALYQQRRQELDQGPELEL